ncbi:MULTISPECIES: 50S ribosomal protein L24 [Okeania]|uniref:Large ribosomal subunit protein uL24 n=1 Tax=Okeania hirsuta TaxID=1458930 RepID=A0A3N6PSK5_9CYAN|nr:MULTISPECIES: 50S ribosomal protein L24 [Okeania]NEP04063.1 50S ribosomal protein L24 [Okeania sp. SIO4D6]NEP42698.1 50S ribosomal protein L24 [Okeania sp. SIO2H7]NET15824.1 50S ribosomal protein L24 [Okeania sp. SIO1H6]NEP71928.1 50S ribosomal protein L24 [Okeania sp. SIO2G5]NEP93027.1 50S ribosomal protein L24 [Okeania sp. SIO2F5]
MAKKKKSQMSAQGKPIRYKMHVKKGDTVQIIAGKDKGKVGEILKVLPKVSKVVVKEINVKTKHVKPQQEGESGKIVTIEAPIHSSNVMLYSSKEKVASRICYTFTDDGRKVRKLKKTGEIID